MPKIFGLDLSGPIIRVAQMPNKFASGANIQEAIKKAGIKTKYLNACLPEEECFIRLIPKDGDIIKEIEANIPLPLDEIYYDWQEIGANLFIAAAKKKFVDQKIALFKQAGLIMNALEPESIALSRTLAKTNSGLLIIKFEKNKINLVVCQKNVVYSSATREKDHISEQVQDYIDFYQNRGGKIVKIILCGSQIPREQAFQNLKIPVETAKNPSYAAAVGLALRQ